MNEYDNKDNNNGHDHTVPSSHNQCDVSNSRLTRDEYFAHLIDFAGIPLFTLDKEGLLRDANSAWLSIHQFIHSTDVLDKPFIDIISDLEPSSAVKGYHNALSGLTSTQFETTIRHTGKFTPYIVSMLPTQCGDTIIGMTGILTFVPSRYDPQTGKCDGHDVTAALSNMTYHKNIIPICASCKRVRDQEGYWNQLERLICKIS